MRGKSGCPECEGRGVILDPDPMAPVRLCACTLTPLDDGAVYGIPARYRQASFESFWEWWKIQHPKDKISSLLTSAHQMVDHDLTRATLPEELRSKLELILHKCGARTGESTWKDVRPGQEPRGYRMLFNWARHNRDVADVWWIDGPPASGRSTLAASALKSCGERSGQAGLFVSVRTFSQELKDTYYDSRSFQNVDFISERDRMAPLLKAPFLVLDDLDRLDSDIRVVRAVAQLLDARYAEELPTIVTASRWADTLLGSELNPFARLEDPSLARRLSQARRIELRPILERLMESLNA